MQENINAICVLALNMINDKVINVNFMITVRPTDRQVFLVLWWWFFLVSVIGIVRLVYRWEKQKYRWKDKTDQWPQIDPNPVCKTALSTDQHADE